MSILSDSIDRLSLLASTVRSSASATGRSSDDANIFGTTAGPFTRAVLETPLGNLIRDIDPSELGLFTLVQPSNHAVLQGSEEGAPPNVEIARVDLPIATPLRKPPAMMRGRDGTQRPGEHEPEVYASAALKFLARYESIRPMPRYSEQAERILNEVDALRENISELTLKLQQQTDYSSVEPHVDPKARVKDEERRIEEAQARIEELRRHKEVLVQKQRAGARGGSRLGVARAAKKQAPTSDPPDAQEDTFWNTPGASVRTLRFTGDLLADEKMDFADISAASLPSPILEPRRTTRSAAKSLQFTTRDPDVPSEVPITNKYVEIETKTTRTTQQESPRVDEDEEEVDDKTVVLTHVPPRINSSEPAVEPLKRARETSSTPEAEQPPAKVQVTADVGRITSKIWATVGEIIMPGNSFDVSGFRSNPPSPRETIEHLKSLAAQDPSPSSPSAASVSSLSTLLPSGGHPTVQQILTAQVLLALLHSPPSYSMSLNKLKEALGSKQGAAQVTKPIYSCVAKRLLKIDRGGGEQTVRFDV